MAANERKPERGETAAAAEEPAFLERVGLRYMAKRSKVKPPAVSTDDVHVLNAGERQKLRLVERGAVIRGAMVGTGVALLVAVTELLGTPLLGPHPDQAQWPATFHYWLLVTGVGAIASLLEVAFLYWESLRSVHELTRHAGLDAFREGAPSGPSSAASAITRAALELPSEQEPVFGVDPRREVSKTWLFLTMIVYKLRFSVANFVLKSLVRRVLGRAALRAWLPLVSVPLTAAWDAAIMWWILREARVRTMGPSAAVEHIDALLDEGRAEGLSRQGRIAVRRAVAAAIVRTRDLHPNLLAVLERVQERTGDLGDKVIDDPDIFLKSLGEIDDEAQDLALRVLTLSIIVDGRMSFAERRLLRDAQEAAGVEVDVRPAKRMRRLFVTGQDFTI